MKYYIVGYGRNFNKVMENVGEFVNVVGICDNDPEKIGRRIGEWEIISIGDFLKNNPAGGGVRAIVSVSQSRARWEIQDQLDKGGYIEGKDYVFADKVIMAYKTWAPGRIKHRKVPKGYHARISFDQNSYLVRSEDDKIYRVIQPEYAEIEKYVYHKCKEAGFIGEVIVDSWIREDVPGFEGKLLIEHRYIPTISFCYEWTNRMYEDYVLWYLELIKKLTLQNLGMCDIHALNATFYQGRFLLVDFGAVSGSITSPRQLVNLMEYVILPFFLKMRGLEGVAHKYLEDGNEKLSLREVKGILSEAEYHELCNLYEQIVFSETKEDVLDFIHNMKKYMRVFHLDEFEPTSWTDYQDSEWEKSDNPAAWSPKMLNAARLLQSISPQKVVDVAGNQGWYGCLCQDSAESISVIDLSEGGLDKLYQRIKGKNIRNVIPVKMSICAPSLGRHIDGFVDGLTVQALRDTGIARYRGDLAIALALVHHLVFRELLLFEEIIAMLSAYTTKHLLVEFVQIDDRYITDFEKDGFEWYTKGAFEEALRQEFEVIETAPSSPPETRTLYLCKKLSSL